MRWGIGTGRCGTRSLAFQMNGIHEPKPWINGLPNAWRKERRLSNRKKKIEPILEKIIDERSWLDTEIVVDFQQTLCIDLILKVDPDAEFVAVFRKPLECIGSFMVGGATQQTVSPIVHPLEPWNRWTDDLFKIMFHYKWINHEIYQLKLRLKDRVKVIKTESLEEHVNKYPKKYDWHPEIATYVSELCGPIYERLESCQ